MATPGSFEDFVPGGLDALGIEASETDLVIMRAAHEIWWPAIEQLMHADLSAVEPELDPDLSRSPRA